MKVVLDPDGHLSRITKAMPPAQAHGEYIGVTLIRGTDSARLVSSLERTWNRDASLYYEDGFQTYVDDGGVVDTHAIGPVEWVEVDTHADWEMARAIACRY
jgi:choline kinase